MSHRAITTTKESATVGLWPNARRRPTGTWRADLGPFCVTGQPTRAAAIAAVIDQAADFNPYRRTYLFTQEGSVVCVRHAADGWGYDITGAHRTKGTGIDRCSCSINAYATSDEAEAAALKHIEGSFGGLAVQASQAVAS